MVENFSVSFQMKKNKMKRNGRAPIYLRILLDSKRVEISTKRYLEPNKWDNKGQKQKGNTEEARTLNLYLNDLVTKVYKLYNHLADGNEPLTLATIKDELNSSRSKGKKIVEIFDENNKLMEAEKGINYTENTVERYFISVSRLKEFIKKEYRCSDMYLNDLDYKFMKRYELFLRMNYKCSHNTAMKYLKHLKKVVHWAMKYGYIEKDPFLSYKTSYKEVNRGYLTADELKRIKEKNFRLKRLEEVRDVFVFVCYTGLPYSDLRNLTRNNIVKGIDGKNWIVYERIKTGVRASVPLLPTAQAIIDRYKEDPECEAKGKLLPIRSNQKLNAYLSEIAELCEINKHVTMHLGRHTFATTVTLTNGVPIETVQRMLGHKNLSTTQIYSKVVDTKVSDDMDKVEGLIEHSNQKFNRSGTH